MPWLLRDSSFKPRPAGLRGRRAATYGTYAHGVWGAGERECSYLSRGNSAGGKPPRGGSVAAVWKSRAKPLQKPRKPSPAPSRSRSRRV